MNRRSFLHIASVLGISAISVSIAEAVKTKSGHAHSKVKHMMHRHGRYLHHHARKRKGGKVKF